MTEMIILLLVQQMQLDGDVCAEITLHWDVPFFFLKYIYCIVTYK